MEPVNDVWIVSHASQIRAGNVPSQHAGYSLSESSFHSLLCRVWRTIKSLPFLPNRGCQVSAKGLKNCKTWEEQRTQKPKTLGPGEEKCPALGAEKLFFSSAKGTFFFLEKRRRLWCRRDEQEEAELQGGLDPSKDPQPPLKVTEAREGSQG